MKSTTFRSAVGAVLTAALSAVVLPVSAASAAENAENPAAATTVDATTARSFGRLADAVLTQRTAALLDDGRSARRAAPLA